MADPYYPEPDPNNPDDPLAHPNAVPPPPGGPTPPPKRYTNTNEGRSEYLNQFSANPWYNGPLFDEYLQTHPDWTENIPYWDKRFGDAPGTGSNTPAPKQSDYLALNDPSFKAEGTPALGDVNMPGQSDLMQQIMAELDAQEQGGESPRTRQMHLRMLKDS